MTQQASCAAILSALSKVHGEPYDPDHPLNKDPDFQLGYVRGLLGEDNNKLQGITDEWTRRGKPRTADSSFRNWKRGYWAGRFTAMANLNEP